MLAYIPMHHLISTMGLSPTYYSHEYSYGSHPPLFISVKLTSIASFPKQQQNVTFTLPTELAQHPLHQIFPQWVQATAMNIVMAVNSPFFIPLSSPSHSFPPPSVPNSFTYLAPLLNIISTFLYPPPPFPPLPAHTT